ncbi:MAG: sigma-70 family RNA polymerase sigma factor [Chloroflexi bacterium]|nr:sigma-70 family RNA polymerase sigma factor [Chloroflexota bacterium]
MTLDDQVLISRLQAGDLEALGQLFDRHQTRVYRTALAVVGDPAAADDIAQDVFLRLHRYADRIDLSLPLAPWLYRVTVNLSCTWTARRTKWLAPLEDFIERLKAPASLAPELQAEHNDQWERVRDAISGLPMSQRVVMVLYYLNDLSLNEIAEIVACPVGTVKSRLHYGRENLRRRLGSSVAPLPEVAYEFT